MKKVISILLIIFIILFIGNYSFADESSAKKGDVETETSIKEEDKSHIKSDLGELSGYVSNGGDIGNLEDKAEVVVGILRTVGTIISVVALILIGIKYMLGSVEEKADYKKTLVPYLIGAILVFSVSLIPQLIYDIVKEFD